VAATTAGALKAYIESLGLGIPAFRRVAPPEHKVPPYITVQDTLNLSADRSGDQGDPDARMTGSELVQVDLWESVHATDGSGERYGLPALLLRHLRNARLPIIGTSRVYGVVGVYVVHVPEPDPESELVHHAVTCTVRRAL